MSRLDSDALESDEIDLDPQDWDEFASLAHRAVDDMVEFLRTVRERPPWKPLPERARADLIQPLPRSSSDLASVYETFRESVLPYPTGNIHPRFWGWVMGTGTADGVLSEMLAATMNSHVGGWDQSAYVMERQVLRWLAEMLGYPTSASGLLVSGCTAANLTAVAVARRAMAELDVREEGLAGPGRPRLRVYGSAETHSWAKKCCDLLGLGRQGFRLIAVDSRGAIDLDQLRATLHADRAAGDRPICVVGNAGTVNTGAFDDLEALADLCVEENLWFHVDGAFGALAALVPELEHLVRGLGRADSVAFDLHKWGYLQYEVGCVLVRNADLHRETFAMPADYLRTPGRGIQPEALEMTELGVQLSRGFRALKVWMLLKTHGVDKLGQVIAQNVEQARYLASRVEREPHLELLAPVPLNLVCFRYVGKDLAEDQLDDVNQEILLRVQEGGIAIPSSTRIDGRFALRVANTNHRSRRKDFDLLVDGVLKIGAELEVEMGVEREEAVLASV
ncbi:MAG: pyridoxal-dependent decarboxylase [Acidobacteriota bacterium]